MKFFVLGLINFYQKFFSPDHNRFWGFGWMRCRFFPSCSDYSISAISQYGLLYGLVFSLRRIFRCNPWNKGGYDPLKSKIKH